MTQPDGRIVFDHDKQHRPGCGIARRERWITERGGRDLTVPELHRLADEIQVCCGIRMLKAHRLSRGWRVAREATDALNALAADNGSRYWATIRAWQFWEAGHNRPTDEAVDLLSELFQTNALYLGIHPDFTPIEEADGMVGSTDGQYRRVILTGRGREGRPNEVSPTERRDFFGVAGIAAGSVLTGPHLLRHALDTGSVSPERLDWIEAEAGQLAYQSCRVTDQAPLLVPARELFDYVAGLIAQPQRLADKVGLVRSAGNLAGLIGKIHFESNGQYREAERWYQESLAAALEIGDRHLADLALLGLAFLPLYQRDYREVLALTGPRLDHPGNNLTVGVAALNGLAARAHAALGEDAACQRDLDTAQDVLERAPQPEVSGFLEFNPARLEFYRADAALTLSDTGGAIRAADRAASLFDSNVNGDRVLVRFDKAAALSIAGEREEACRVATEAISDPNLLFGTSVKARAEDFDNELGTTSAPAVRDWRAAYMDTARRSEPATFA